MTDERIPWLDLKRQYFAYKDEIDAAVHRVLESGYYASGSETRAFEQEWAAYCLKARCVALGNGTTSLNLALRSLGVGPGDEVITVAFTLSATLDAIVELGATPVLVDVDAYTYTMDASQVGAKITPRTKAILPVHIYGHPADMDSILAIASSRGLPVVSDACEAHGTLYKGRPVASLGTASCFSFYPTKNLGGLGDGGGVVTDEEALVGQLEMLRNHGWRPRFHSMVSSLNSRMDEVNAAVLRTKLPHLAAWNARRSAIAARYDEALRGTSITPSPKAAWAEPSYYLYVVRTAERDRLRAALTEAAIDTDVHWPEPLHVQPGFAGLGYGRGSLPVTEQLCDQVVTLPMFPELSDAEVGRICETLARVAARATS